MHFGERGGWLPTEHWRPRRKATDHILGTIKHVRIPAYPVRPKKHRGLPLSRGPEADETKTMAVTLPHRV